MFLILIFFQGRDFVHGLAIGDPCDRILGRDCEDLELQRAQRIPRQHPERLSGSTRSQQSGTWKFFKS